MMTAPIGRLHDAGGRVKVEADRAGVPGPRVRLDSSGRIWKVWDEVVSRRQWFQPDREHVIVFSLGRDLELLAWHVAAVGSSMEADLRLSDVFRPALLAEAAGIMLGHNHPSGGLSPSAPDVEMTLAAVEAGEILGVPVVDHVIFGNGSLSLRYCAQSCGYPGRRVAGWKTLKTAWRRPQVDETPRNLVAFSRGA